MEKRAAQPQALSPDKGAGRAGVRGSYFSSKKSEDLCNEKTERMGGKTGGKNTSTGRVAGGWARPKKWLIYDRAGSSGADTTNRGVPENGLRKYLVKYVVSEDIGRRFANKKRSRTCVAIVLYQISSKRSRPLINGTRKNEIQHDDRSIQR